MGKENNLKDFCTDIADAIREKKGTTDLINPQNFSEEILSIESGGGDVVEVEEKDICFYDYDGTLLYSYTLAEAQALTELPPLPTQEGLICQGWNWDYEDVIALDYPMDIGAMYITDDGKTRFYLEVEDEEGVDIELRFTQDVANGVIVDFGDGSDVITFEELTINTPHHYAKGSYILTTQIVGDAIATFSNTDSYHNVFGNIADKSSDALIKVELGERTEFGSYAFKGCSKLKNLALHFFKEFGWSETFVDCISLECVVYPKKQQYIFGNSISNCNSIKVVSMPNSMKYANTGFKYCRLLRRLCYPDNTRFSGIESATNIESFRIPRSTTSLANRAFYNCWSLKNIDGLERIETHVGYLISDCYSFEKIVLPESWTTVDAHDFYKCVSLKEIVLPPHIESIGVYAFNGCACKIIDFSKSDIVPTLANTNAFTKSNPDFRIVVPDALYDEWIAATNWATYADRIVKSSEYTE